MTLSCFSAFYGKFSFSFRWRKGWIDGFPTSFQVWGLSLPPVSFSTSGERRPWSLSPTCLSLSHPSVPYTAGGFVPWKPSQPQPCPPGKVSRFPNTVWRLSGTSPGRATNMSPERRPDGRPPRAPCNSCTGDLAVMSRQLPVGTRALSWGLHESRLLLVGKAEGLSKWGNGGPCDQASGLCIPSPCRRTRPGQLRTVRADRGQRAPPSTEDGHQRVTRGAPQWPASRTVTLPSRNGWAPSRASRGRVRGTCRPTCKPDAHGNVRTSGLTAKATTTSPVQPSQRGVEVCPP